MSIYYSMDRIVCYEFWITLPIGLANIVRILFTLVTKDTSAPEFSFVTKDYVLLQNCFVTRKQIGKY